MAGLFDLFFSSPCSMVGEAMLMGAGGKLFSGSLCIVFRCFLPVFSFLLPLNLGRKIVC